VSLAGSASRYATIWRACSAPLVDVARLPRKALLIALMVTFILGNVATVYAPSYGPLIAARFLAGLTQRPRSQEHGTVATD